MHTPGPWKCWDAWDLPHGRVVISRIGPDGEAGIRATGNADVTCSKEDAALIASAPELLGALQSLVYVFEKLDYANDEHPALQHARAIIEKAKGA